MAFIAVITNDAYTRVLNSDHIVAITEMEEGFEITMTYPNLTFIISKIEYDNLKAVLQVQNALY